MTEETLSLDTDEFLKRLEESVSSSIECLRFVAFHNPLPESNNQLFRTIAFFVSFGKLQSLSLDLAYPEAEFVDESTWEEQFQSFAKSLEIAIHNHREGEKDNFMALLKKNGLNPELVKDKVK